MQSPSGARNTAEAVASLETGMQHDQGTDRPDLDFKGMNGKTRALLGVVVGSGAVIASIGFIGSYRAVQQLAHDKFHMGWFSYLFPVGIDFGIVGLLALDLAMTALRMPFPMLRYTAWLLTAATIGFNAASGYPHLLEMAGHAIIPMLFIVVMEGARYAIARIAALEAGRTSIDGVRLVRWILSPWSTFRIWRRMRMFEITSYDDMVDREQDRLVYKSVLRFHHRGSGTSPDPAEKLPLKLARFGRRVPKLDVPATDFVKKYGLTPAATPPAVEQPAVVLERVQLEPGAGPAETAAPDHLAGLTPELVAKLVELAAAEQPAVPRQVEPAAVPQQVDQQSAVPYGGIVPLRRTDRPAPEQSSTWFQPEATAPVGEPWSPSAETPQTRVDRPSPATDHYRQAVHARVPEQEPEAAPVVERLPAADPESEVVAATYATDWIKQGSGAWTSDPLLYSYPEAEVVTDPQEALEPATEELQPEEAEPVEQAPAAAGLEETQALSGKDLLVKLMQELTPEQKAMSQKDLAADLFPRLAHVMGSPESVRAYIGRYQRGTLKLTAQE